MVGLYQIIKSTTVCSVLVREFRFFFFCSYAPAPEVKTQRPRQYALAINAPPEQCADYIDNNFLSKYPADNVKNSMSGGDNLYTAAELIGAERRKIKKDVYIHSESVLLRIPDKQGEVPMRRLVNKYSDGCVAFYTYNSPCVQTCTDPDGQHSILPALEQLFQSYQGPKAFIFSEVFPKDEKKTELAQRLRLVDERVPLYRCPRNAQTGHIDECFVCRDSAGNISEKCLTP